MQAETIDEVLKCLDQILAECKVARSRMGFFPALYRIVTESVKLGIQRGFFDDGPRMEQLDVVFANRYLSAYRAWQQNQKPSRSWQVAFENALAGGEIILQDLLLGINAHINLDLGIAAAQIAPGPKLAGLQADFDRINQILGQLIDPVEKAVGKFSPLIGFLDTIGGKTEGNLIGFSMSIARAEAWRNAEILALLDGETRDKVCQLIDGKVALLGQKVAQPPGFLATGLRTIRLFESRNVVAIIDGLSVVPAIGR